MTRRNFTNLRASLFINYQLELTQPFRVDSKHRPSFRVEPAWDSKGTRLPRGSRVSCGRHHVYSGSQRVSIAMGLLLIRCPATKQEFPILYDLSEEDFLHLPNNETRTPCPYCHALHRWRVSDARFGEAKLKKMQAAL